MEENIKRKDWDEIHPKTIFSGNGNGLKNFTFLSTREQMNVHTVYAKQDWMIYIYMYSVVCNKQDPQWFNKLFLSTQQHLSFIYEF